MTADIVTAFVESNATQASELPSLISTTYTALAALGTNQEPQQETVEKPSPQAIRRSVTPDALTSFIDGKKYKSLKRHITSNGMTWDEYRERYGLPADYPSVAPNYSAARSAMAKAIGLGSKGHGRAPAKGKKSQAKSAG